ncbi:helix-turn-helix domain-containing protein [Pantoea sp. PSNIH1]|uniref:helix-turn-helix domain-containing protein n=1 Tax=Pantoea sp. PSNIH1 TaxID=1484158 RepID=UPI00119DE1B1|nr:helix-turn-helix domain-containing protein [Pantoea sp. PSNIH1]
MMKTMTPFEREALFLALLRQSIEEKASHGKLLMQLRKQVLGFSQDRYAALAGISRRTLSDIEQDKESVTLNVLNRAFRPLGLEMGVLPQQSHMRQTLIALLAQQGASHDHP